MFSIIIRRIIDEINDRYIIRLLRMIKDIIYEKINIDYNVVKLNNDNYTEPNKYDICRNFSIILRDGYMK
jgi:hypothetical protein